MDGQKDIFLIARPRLHCMQRGENQELPNSPQRRRKQLKVEGPNSGAKRRTNFFYCAPPFFCSALPVEGDTAHTIGGHKNSRSYSSLQRISSPFRHQH